MAANRRVLVTGASGLVASGVVKNLLQAGYDVLGLSRRPRPANVPGLTWTQGDFAGYLPAVLDHYLPLNAVVHLAAVIGSQSPTSLSELRMVNMEATERLFQYCGNAGVEKVVFASSLSVLARPLRDVIEEDHPIGPTQPYSISKYWGELALQSAAQKHGFTGVILRFSSPVCDQFDLLSPTVLQKWLRLAKCGKSIPLWGRGSRTQDFVSVEDIGLAVVRSLDRRPASGVLHIASGRPTSMRALAGSIAALGHVEVEHANPIDPNEDERWNLDLTRAASMLGFAPRFFLSDYLPKLWEQAPCVAL